MSGQIDLKECAITVDNATRYVLRNVGTEVADYEDFVDEMVAESTVTRHDVKAVVSALEEFICRALVNGYSVRLGDLGSFRTTVKSEGQETAEAVTADTITAVRVQFTAGSLLKEYLQVAGSAKSVKLSVVETLE